MNIIITEEPY